MAQTLHQLTRTLVMAGHLTTARHINDIAWDTPRVVVAVRYLATQIPGRLDAEFASLPGDLIAWADDKEQELPPMPVTTYELRPYGVKDGLAGEYTQKTYTCHLCGHWTTDHRYVVPVKVRGDETIYECDDRAICARTQQRNIR